MCYASLVPRLSECGMGMRLAHTSPTLLILLPTDITTRCIVFYPVKAAVSQARSVVSVTRGLAGPPCVTVHSPKVQEQVKRNCKNKL